LKIHRKSLMCQLFLGGPTVLTTKYCETFIFSEDKIIRKVKITVLVSSF
jgi:hypothetical protein